MYLVLPLVRAAPFELLGPWCPSFLLPGFTIDTSWCASVKRCKKTSSAFCWFLFCLFVCFFSPSSLSPLSHSPAGFSQMEVAQHSRPALHNLRMKEGGSASHYTRFEPRRWWGALVRRGAAVRTLLFFFYPEIHAWESVLTKYVFTAKMREGACVGIPQFVNLKRPGVSSTGYLRSCRLRF